MVTSRWLVFEFPNCANQRSTLACNPPPAPGPKWKKVISADSPLAPGTSNCALRIAEAGTSHFHSAGRSNKNRPTSNSTGDSANAKTEDAKNPNNPAASLTTS
jgi:hypothetical protein